LKRLITVLLVLIVFWSTQLTQASAQGTTERIQGADRFEVAVNVSKKGWPTTGSAKTVVLVNYNAYADALSATPLAYRNEGPILLTHPNYLTSASKEEIRRLQPNQVIVVGGSGSISDSVLNEVRSIGIPNVRRISGLDRYEVAYQIAKELPASPKVVVAYGLNFPDALAIAPYAARNGYPILLSNKNDIPQKTREALSYRNPQGSIVVGGEGSVSASVFNQLPSPLRIGGKDRYEVAANVIKALNLSSEKSFVATGLTFADALSGSVLAAKLGSPILLTDPNTLPESTRLTIAEKDINNFIILGGLASVSQKVVSQIAGPLSGLKIVVDAGHGGTDPGAVANGLKEEDIVLDVAKRVKPKLESAGAAVIMTRESDVYPKLAERVQLANSQKADAFLSIHANASTSTAAYGTETYWDSQYFGPESKLLAEYIQSQLVSKMGTRDRGVKEAPFYVIHNTTMPSVLIELAFITNSSDAAKLANSSYREKAAQAIYEGTLNYYRYK
jgi:N-acetylmuramoyl-L-alanine amidase